MSGKRVSMDRVARDEPQVPLRSPRANPVGLAIVVGLAALGFVAAATGADNAITLAVTASAALMLVLLLVSALLMPGDISERVVRIQADAAELRFVGPAAVPTLFWLAALVGSVPVVAALVFGFDYAGRALFLIGAVAVFWVGQQLWGLRTPRGLTLSEQGLRGVRGSKPVRLAWDDLSYADVATTRQGAKLVLHLRPTGVIVITPHYTGSDPNVLAPLINFFLAHPEQRATLATPMAALVVVEAEASATRKAD
jgi:hypothetical protein